MECQQASRYRNGAKCNELSRDDAIYMAGFIDGEGSIILTGHRGKAELKLGVVNTNKAVLLWMCEVTGIGAVHLHQKEEQKKQQSYMWSLNADAVESLLLQLLPYLKVKKAQAELGIETHSRLRDPALNADRVWQSEYIIRMKTLNARANSKYYGG
jgi:hypothetical protein